MREKVSVAIARKHASGRVGDKDARESGLFVVRQFHHQVIKAIVGRDDLDHCVRHICRDGIVLTGRENRKISDTKFVPAEPKANFRRAKKFVPILPRLESVAEGNWISL